MTLDLFPTAPTECGDAEPVVPGAIVLRRFALFAESALFEGVNSVVGRAPFRRWVTPGGFRMSVAMTNCGQLGWVADKRGYRYDPLDPLTDLPWPSMPAAFRGLAARAAARAGFEGFRPDACLINRYRPGAKLSLHQDADEPDASQPIVSISLGAPATFLFGSARRSDPASRIPLSHGDVVVWGGPARRHFHGVLPLKAGRDVLLGGDRINLAFRKAT